MATTPPFAPPGLPPPAPAGDTEESRECPVCHEGQIPAGMGRDEMIQAINEGMPTPEQPEKGEPHSPMGRGEPLTPDQQTEVSRQGQRVQNRMRGPRTFGM